MSDLTPRDQLAEIISHTENLTDEEGSWALPEDVADEIIRAGWRPPARVIHTVEEAEALRDSTAVVDRFGDVGVVRYSALIYAMDDIFSVEDALTDYGPLTVVWEPSEEEDE